MADPSDGLHAQVNSPRFPYLRRRQHPIHAFLEMPYIIAIGKVTVLSWARNWLNCRRVAEHRVPGANYVRHVIYYTATDGDVHLVQLLLGRTAVPVHSAVPNNVLR